MNIFDVAVVGTGTMGSFACLELARRKLRVIGIDQFTPPHNRGSHTGDTRIFRTAYAEHPGYVPLAQRAGLLWDQLGEEAGSEFLHRTGLLSLGPESGALIAGTRASAASHGIAIEELSPSQVRSRFPAFDPPGGWVGLFEATAGWLDVDAVLRFGLASARRAGAELRMNIKVDHWVHRDGEFEIRAAGEKFTTKSLVVTAGAWASRLLDDLGLSLTVLRKSLIWVAPLRPELFAPDFFPVFVARDDFFYGFPNIHNVGVKLAIHANGDARAADPDAPLLEPDGHEIDSVLAMAAELLPHLAGPVAQARARLARAKTCLYTMTPDEHFVIDRHPQVENLFIAAGFSGHGFKFATAIGELLADWVCGQKSTLPIDFLRLKRDGLMKP